MSHQADTRKARLTQLAERYWIEIPDPDAEHYDSAATEDLAEYLCGDIHTDRWVAVTLHDSTSYFVKTFPTREQAEAYTIEYINDDLFTEAPVAVVDLDADEACGKIYRLRELIPIFEGSEHHDADARRHHEAQADAGTSTGDRTTTRGWRTRFSDWATGRSLCSSG